VLLGSVGAAKERIEEYSKFGASTPFELGEIAQAGRVLQVFGGDLLATGDNLRLVGDIAAGTNTPFQETAMWIGRMYDALQSGRPWGEAATRLQEMGALSGEARAELESMQKSGESGTAIWAKFNIEMSRFQGMMDDLSGTRSGKWSTTLDTIKQGMREILDGGTWDMLNQGLSDFNTMLNDLISSGALREVGYFITSFAEVSQGIFLGALGGIGAFVYAGVIYPITNAIDVVLGMTQMLINGVSTALSALPKSVVPDGLVQSLAQANQSILGVRMSVVGFQQTTNDMIAKAGVTAWDLLTSKVQTASSAIDEAQSKTQKGKARPTTPGMSEQALEEAEKMQTAVEAANARFRKAKREAAQEDARIDEEYVEKYRQAQARLAEASLPAGDEIAALRLKQEEELALYQEGSEAKLMIEQAHAKEMAALQDEIAKRRPADADEHAAYTSRITQMNAQVAASTRNLASSMASAMFQSRKNAPILFAIQKGIAAASIISSSLAAESAASAPPPIGVGHILGPALAAKTRINMYTNLALLAATSIAEGAQKFADGGIANPGIVPGSAYFGDTVNARLNSREMVLNMGQQAQLFAYANGAAPTSKSRVTNNYDITWSPVMPQSMVRTPDPTWEQMRRVLEYNKVEFAGMLGEMVKRGY
jgi:hypothetical protein